MNDAYHGRLRACNVLDNQACALTTAELDVKSQDYRTAYLEVLSEYPVPECLVLDRRTFDELLVDAPAPREPSLVEQAMEIVARMAYADRAAFLGRIQSVYCMGCAISQPAKRSCQCRNDE